MESITKRREQFHYFNINSKEDSVFGNWAVSQNGDVVNCLYPYAIFAIHIMDRDWLSYVKKKTWFRPECEDDLKQALQKARDIMKSH